MGRNRNRRRQKNKRLEDVAISNMAAGGKGMLRKDGKVIFVEGAIPGDLVDVFLTKNRKDYAMGKAVAIKKASSDRIPPFCQHFDSCGGCKWQFMTYAKQLEYKQKIVEEALTHIGKLNFPPLLPILGADPTRYYRNKMEFTFSNKRWLSQHEVDTGIELTHRNALGLHVPGMFDRVVDIEHCYLQGDLSNDLRNTIRDYALQHQLSFYDIRQHTGFLRNLIIRTSSLGETMVIICLSEEKTRARIDLLDYVLEKFPQITSLHYVINPKKNDTIFDLSVETYHGRGYIFEELGGLRYKISPKSFFQTNTHQALRLYETVKSFANLTGKEIVYDLYTGTGSIGIFLSQKARKIVGIEEIPAAIEDAKFNAALNGLTNTAFFAGDVKAMLSSDFAAQHGQPDLLVTDPPRAGMHAHVVEQLLDIQPKRLIYVSCNPATQARDLQLLSEKYTIQQIQPVDMFPHTYHIENVVSLELNF